MSFDITYHPVSAGELQRFVFDVIDTPSLLEARLAELLPDDDLRGEMKLIYEAALWIIEQERIDLARDAAGDRSGDDFEDIPDAYDEELPCSAGHGARWLAASVASCLHPHWKWRGADLLLREDARIGRLFRPLAEIGTGRIREIHHWMGPDLSDVADASGFLPPAEVRGIDAHIKWKDVALAQAIDYAASRGLGLIEASNLNPLVTVHMREPEPVKVRDDFMKYVEVDGDPQPQPTTTPMKVVYIGVGLLLIAGARILMEARVSLLVFVAVLLGISILGRIALRELSSRTDD